MRSTAAGCVLVFVGVVLIGVGALITYQLGTGDLQMTGRFGQPLQMDRGIAEMIPQLVLYGLGGLFLLIGIPAIGFGLVSGRGGANRQIRP